MSYSMEPLEGKDRKDELELDQPTAVLESNAGPSQSKKTKWLGSSDYTTVRGMKSRHLSFIAIGGTIGTGIFLSSGTSVATAGAGGALVAYLLVGFFVFGVMLTLGEMAAFLPVSGAFSTFAERFVSPALGAGVGWNYFIQWTFSIPSELVAASVILNFWTQALNTWQWSLIIVFPVFAIQLIHVRAFAEAEFWLALIKVILVVMFIIVGLLYDWGAISGHPGPGLSNFNDGPFFGGAAGVFASFTYAFYSFGGTELVALAAGESKNPQKSVPTAIRATFIRILLFYVMTILVIGLCINRNDPTLFSAYSDSDVAASPITTVFVSAGFGAAVHVVNAVLLTAVLSATESCFYASSRMLLSLAKSGKAPKIFGYTTKRGVPVPALLVVLAFSSLTFLTTIWGEGVVFTWLINITGVSALFTWITIALTNIRFRRAFKAQGRDLSDLPFRAPLSPYLACSAIILGFCMFAAQNWAATTYGDTGAALAKDIVAVDIGLVLFFGVTAGFAIHQKITKPGVPLLVPLLEVDLVTNTVWGPGGGKVWREDEARLKAERNAGTKWYSWQRVKSMF